MDIYTTHSILVRIGNRKRHMGALQRKASMNGVRKRILHRLKF